MTTLIQQTHTLLDLLTRLEASMLSLDHSAVLSSIDQKLDALLARNEQLDSDLTSFKTSISPLLDLPARMAALEATLSRPKTPKHTTPRKRRASLDGNSPLVSLKRRRLNSTNALPANVKPVRRLA